MIGQLGQPGLDRVTALQRQSMAFADQCLIDRVPCCEDGPQQTPEAVLVVLTVSAEQDSFRIDEIPQPIPGSVAVALESLRSVDAEQADLDRLAISAGRR